MMNKKIEKLKEYIQESNNIVFFGGAGVSTESGIPDFRSKDGLPNITHLKLVELENKGKLKAIITQNIDGLHQKAGSKNVYELHGSVLKNYCMKCNKFYDAEYVFGSDNIPKCSCGGIIKPDVVLYEEGLDESTLYGSIHHIQNADLMIVAGTSLTVQPASSLINYFRGKHLVLINKDKTMYDNKADLVINEALGNVFKEV